MQNYSSKNTSLNQISAILKLLEKRLEWKAGQTNFDNGGGKYDKGTEYLKGLGVINLIYDPENRTPEHNSSILSQLEDRKADTSTIANVLNVIDDAEARLNVLRLSKKYAKKTFISVYDGDKSGIGKVTTKGYQLNKKLQEYIPEIKKVFDNVEKKSGYIIAW